MSHPLFFMCFSHSHLRITSGWDSWGSGMLSGGSWALPPADKATESTSWSCTVPQALCPSCACSSWCAAPAAACTRAEDVLFQELIYKGHKGQVLHLALHVCGFGQCFVKSNRPLLSNFAVKLDLNSYYTEMIFLVNVLT